MAVQEYDSKALSSGRRGKELRRFRKEAHSSENGPDERDAPESRKLDLSMVWSARVRRCAANCEHVLFYNASK